MPKFLALLIITIFNYQFTFGQLTQKRLQEGYEYYNSREIVISPDKILLSNTLNPNQIQFVCKWINSDSIVKNFEAKRSMVGNRLEYLQISLDSVFSDNQKQQLNYKLQNLERVQLEKNRLTAEYELRDSSFFRQSFPIIQMAKDSSNYVFIYEEAKFSSAFGRIRIEKMVEKEWEWVGSVMIPRFDMYEFKQRIKPLPEEYQVINSFLVGRKAKIKSEFAQIYKGSDGNYDRYACFDTWAKIQKSSFDEVKDITLHFSKSNLELIAKYLNSKILGSINDSFLLDNLQTVGSSEIANSSNKYGLYNISKPYVFKSDLDGELYAIFYWSKTDGPLNGSGNIIIMKKVNGRYVKFISRMLWIS